MESRVLFRREQLNATVVDCKTEKVELLENTLELLNYKTNA